MGAPASLEGTLWLPTSPGRMESLRGKLEDLGALRGGGIGAQLPDKMQGNINESNQ